MVFYAVGAAVLYGAHQIFTKMASDRISDGLGGLPAFLRQMESNIECVGGLLEKI